MLARFTSFNFLKSSSVKHLADANARANGDRRVLANKECSSASGPDSGGGFDSPQQAAQQHSSSTPTTHEPATSTASGPLLPGEEAAAAPLRISCPCFVAELETEQPSKSTTTIRRCDA